MNLAAVDYETEEIQDRPAYPPIPVGVAIKVGTKQKYLAWGHPKENNCTRAEAIRELKPIYRDYECVFHNASFDLEVGEEKLGLRRPKVWHDTMFLAYLVDPRYESLALKALADLLLDMPPTEQDKLKAWIVDNVPGATEKKWGRHIALAPGKLVGRYAIGDVVRTWRLFHHLYPLVRADDMLEAYDRERCVLPIKLTMEQEGVYTAQKRLKRDLPKWYKADAMLYERVKRKLKVTKHYELDCPKGVFNPGSSQQLADALEHAGKVDPDMWIYTDPSDSYPDGQRSTKLENLKRICNDKKLLIDLGMRSVISTYLSTFLEPWIITGEKSDGFLHPTFNQVRTTDDQYGTGTKGTKTGRPSSSNPNFNNIPADVEGSKNKDVLIALRKFMQEKLKLDFVGLRDYIIPDPGCILLARDYSQQEIRVLAHYENGMLLEMYIDDPSLDVHNMVQKMIFERIGIEFPRKAIKIVAFTIIYGGGAGKVAFELDCPHKEAADIISAYLGVLPGVKELKKELMGIARKGERIYTWGGRWYTVEDAKFIKGKLRTFEYKFLNLLIQGSSADITKQAMIQVQDGIRGSVRLQVYDELLVNTKLKHARRDMKEMKHGMEDIELDLPLPTDGSASKVSWGRLKKWKDG